VLDEICDSSDKLFQEKPDFWSMISGIDTEVLLKIDDGTLEHDAQRLAKDYLAAGKHAGSPREFRSVKENFDFLITLINPDCGTRTSKDLRTNINKALVQIRDKL
jgi:hypothetical protein